ncbi:GtrA family protein [Solobacterium moorei]|uniref:GtrA family protein n=1 Tax=Solobacterium moorei TaxID=102148 RepID=A0A412PIE6_9FIRM|nr:GtrA family protein [Solobacterium moorei]RGT57922.1 GtrA family protein [Solobacterium moorei]
MKNMLEKYKSILMYLFFGICTTVINIVTYWMFYISLDFPNVLSTIFSWIISVLFAYITNKLWVFESRSFGKKVLVREIATFFGARFISGIIDLAIMFLFVDMLLFPAMIIKFISNIFVVIFNYVASKVVIFK